MDVTDSKRVRGWICSHVSSFRFCRGLKGACPPSLAFTSLFIYLFIAGCAGEGEGEMISCESLFQCPCFVFSEMQRRVSIQASFHTQGAEAASTAQKPLLQSCSEAKPQLGRMLLNTAHVCMLTDLAGRNLLEILEQEIRGDLMGRMKRLVAKSFKTLSSL